MPKPTQHKQKQLQAYKSALQKAKPFALPVTDKKIVVSLGWGTAVKGGLSRQFPVDSWEEVRIDMSASVAPDLQVESLLKLSAVPDNSVHGVWISHVIQRFSFPDAIGLLKEATRILKEGGEMLVAAPDMQLAATYLARSEHEVEIFRAPAGSVTAIDLMYGFQKSIEAGDSSRIHKSGYSAEMLGYALRTAGICNLHVQRHPYDVIALGKKLPYGHEERVERIVMVAPANTNHPEAPSVPASSRPAAAQTVRYVDRLEDEPKMWKPLGLKKKA
jgi:Methyltransferase domain